jgi:phosphoribosylaminoimidazole-succinocarboxamide synthase
MTGQPVAGGADALDRLHGFGDDARSTYGLAGDRDVAVQRTEAFPPTEPHPHEIRRDIEVGHAPYSGPVLEQTALMDLPKIYSGKVRDLYALPDGSLLFVASDRISAFDHVLPTPIPDKGRVLTQLSMWWFEQLADVVPNHVISLDVPAEVAGRAMVCQRLEMFPVECVARGYLTGSGLTEYVAGGQVCGVPLPPGLVDGSRLPGPIFTPATKAALGDHDENVSFDVVAATVGDADAAELRRITLAVYARAEEIARQRGILLADTKLELGRAVPGGPVILADEVLTPDSSRFWPLDEWEPGHAQPSFDKQYVRDWLTSPASGWDRASDAPPPPLPEAVVAATRAKYVEAYERLTGRTFA